MSELAKFILFFGDDEEESRAEKEKRSDVVDKGQVDYMVLKS